MNLLTEQKQVHWVREQTYGYWKEEWWGEIDWKFGIDMYTLQYVKQVANKN